MPFHPEWKLVLKVRSRSNYLRTSFNHFCAAIYLSSGPDSDTNKVKPTDNNNPRNGEDSQTREIIAQPQTTPSATIKFGIPAIYSGLFSSASSATEPNSRLFPICPYRKFEKVLRLKCTSFNLNSFNLAVWTHQLGGTRRVTFFLSESSGNLQITRCISTVEKL